MPRPIRFFRPGALYECTIRTIQARYLLRPSPRINALIVGIIGRALELYPTVVPHAIAVLSNHIQCLLSSSESGAISAFQEFVNGNISREVGGEVDWSGKLWHRRYKPIEVIDDDAEIDRLKYILSQGCKENLVEHPAQWPGVHCATELGYGRPLEGIWIDRTACGNARRAGKEATEAEFTTHYTVELEPIPSCRSMEPGAYRHLCRTLANGCAREAAAARRPGQRVLGAKAILAAHPHTRPDHADQSPAPPVHTSHPKLRKAWCLLQRAREAQYRECSRRHGAGERDVRFPPGTFPSRLPHVPHDGTPLDLYIEEVGLIGFT